MKEQDYQSQEPDKKQAMDLDFFSNVYAPAILSGSKDGAEFVRKAYEMGALSYDPDLPENQNLISPLDALLQVDLAKLEVLANRPLDTEENIITKLGQKALKLFKKQKTQNNVQVEKESIKTTIGELPVNNIVELRKFLREQVSIENLLSDRNAQAKIDAEIEKQLSRNHPYLFVTLQSKDKDFRISRSAFMLKDRDYFYYFGPFIEESETPSFLRPEDVVTSPIQYETSSFEIRAQVAKNLGINIETLDFLSYELDPRVMPHLLVNHLFNKSINRVPTVGGNAKRYNYNTNIWESKGDGLYKPGLKGIINKVKKILKD